MAPPERFVTFPELLDGHADARPDTLVYVWLGEGETPLEQLTFGELQRRARAIAAGLAPQVKSGDRAIIVLPQGLDFLVAFFGCMYAGVIPVPVSVPSRKRGREIVREIAEDSGARWLLSSGGWLEQLQAPTGEDPDGLCFVDTSTLPRATEGFTAPVQDPDATALLQYTSGSTRSPRGVAITHRNLAANHQQVAACLATDAGTVYVSWLPMFHDMGLGIALQAVWAGVRCVLMSPRAFFQEPLRWLRVISRFRGTTSGGPNSAFELCLQRRGASEIAELDLSSWRVAFNGSEPVVTATLERFARAFAAAGFHPRALHPVYGLAESTLLAASEPPHQGAIVRRFAEDAIERDRASFDESPNSGRSRALVSCGQPWPGTEIAIVEPDSGRELDSGKVGEIWIRGASVSPGYWNRSSETHATFGLTTADGRTGFMRSGDVGMLVNGRLYVLGRQRDVLSIALRKHYPHDIELTASSSHPQLAPYACAAVLAPLSGAERLVLIQEVSRSAVRRLEQAQVVATMRRAVAERHRLTVHGVVLIKPSTLPRTTSGKVRRATCREAFLQQSLPVLHAWFDRSLENRPLEAP